MKNKASFLILISLTIFAVFSQVSNKRWEGVSGVVKSDVKGYYAYLPLYFIYDDIKVEHPKQYMYEKDHLIWYSTAKDGSHYIKFPMGPAILYSPFFFAAHAYASISEKYPADGFSRPYHVFLAISSLFYLLVGLIFLRKILLKYFTDRTSSITMILVYLGSNLWYYYTVEMCMSHGYSFTILLLFLFTSIAWLEKPSVIGSAILGLSIGLLLLLRPVDIIFGSFLLLFKVRSFNDVKNRLIFFWQNKYLVALAIFAAFIVVSPQLIYWKFISGSYFFFSYANEPFFFLDPNLLKSILSYRNGWLIYSPLMVFSLLGIYISRIKHTDFFWFLLLIVPIYFYVIASWWCWWYVGFGNRAFINLYPFLSIALAAFVQTILSSKRKTLIFSSSFFALLLVSLSLFQTWQFSKGILHYSEMTKEAYWDSFGRKSVSQLYPGYLRKVDNDQAKEGNYCVFEPNYENIYEHFNNFENTIQTDKITASIDTDHYYSPKQSYKINEGELYALEYVMSVDSADEVNISLRFRNIKEGALVLSGMGNSNFYSKSTEVIRKDKNWELINLYARFGKNHQSDTLKFYVFNKSTNEMWLDDLSIVSRKVNYVSTPVSFFDFLK